MGLFMDVCAWIEVMRVVAGMAVTMRRRIVGGNEGVKAAKETSSERKLLLN